MTEWIRICDYEILKPFLSVAAVIVPQIQIVCLTICAKTPFIALRVLLSQKISIWNNLMACNFEHDTSVFDYFAEQAKGCCI